MAYSLNGNNAFMDFSIGNLIGVDGGPVSVAVLVNLGDAANGALAHIVNSTGAAGVLFLETFGVMNYGVNTIARSVSSGNLSTLGLVGNWAVLGGSKADVAANPVGHYGLLGGALTHFTAVSSLTDVGGASAADATFKIRLGQFLNSTSEYINGAYAVAAIFKRVLTTAEWDSLSTGTYATWQALTPDWMVEFTGIGSRVDATSGGGNELSRTGTPAISLVADPAGFFGGGPGPQSSTDSFALSDGTFKVATSNVDSFSLAEGGVSLATKDTEAFTFSDGTFRITASDADSFTLTEGAQRLSLTDSDVALLSETQRGSVTASDSFTLDDTVIRGGTSHFDTFVLDEQMRISLTVSDSFTLASELERMGVLSTDAFALADAVFSGAGSVVSGDTFGLIEHQQVSGLPVDPTPTASITIKLSSPALAMKFGTPHLVITLTVPQMRIELE